MSKLKLKPRKLGNQTLPKLLKRVDVFCMTAPDGEVEVIANEFGRRKVQELFPNAEFKWNFDWAKGHANLAKVPDGFGAIALDLVEACTHTQHRIIDVGDIVTANPDQRAYLIAISAKHRGATSSCFATIEGRKQFAIFPPGELENAA